MIYKIANARELFTNIHKTMLRKGERMDYKDDLIKSKDEQIARLEKIVNDLSEAQKQNAATLAGNYRSQTYERRENGFKLSFIISKFKSFLFIFLLLLVIGVVALWLYNGGAFKKSSVTFVENIRELSTLASAETHTKTVVNIKDNKIFGKKIPLPFPGTNREILLIVPATVLAGVDLKEVSKKDMTINEDTKEIDLILPHAKIIQEPSLDMTEIKTIVDGGIFNDEVEWDEGNELTASAQEQVKKEVIDAGLLTKAEENAEKALKQFFKNMGYKLNVTYK